MLKIILTNGIYLLFVKFSLKMKMNILKLTFYRIEMVKEMNGYKKLKLKEFRDLLLTLIVIWIKKS